MTKLNVIYERPFHYDVEPLTFPSFRPSCVLSIRNCCTSFDTLYEESFDDFCSSTYPRVSNKTVGILILFRMVYLPPCPFSELLVYYISSCFIDFQDKVPSYTFIWNSWYIRNSRVQAWVRFLEPFLIFDNSPSQK